MKVHFAGYMNFFQGVDAAGVNYVLDTFYELRKLNDERAKSHIARMNGKRHAIIDSGLFTLMFGAKKGSDISERFIVEWQDQYAAFVKRNHYHHSIVECDVQKVLSADFAWEMRRKFRFQLPNHTIIAAYHLEDENPDKLIDYADYIAVSQPELRFCVSSKERYKITRYIAEKATRKGKRVHLLGCTERKMMKEFAYCYSCDSTSWKAAGRWNRFHTETFNTGKDNGHIDVDIMSRNKDQRFKSKSSNQSYWEAFISRKEYEKYAGSQA